QHREVGLAMPAVGRGVDEVVGPVIGPQDVTGPQIAMQECWRLWRAGELLDVFHDPLDVGGRPLVDGAGLTRGAQIRLDAAMGPQPAPRVPRSARQRQGPDPPIAVCGAEDVGAVSVSGCERAAETLGGLRRRYSGGDPLEDETVV